MRTTLFALAFLAAISGFGQAQPRVVGYLPTWGDFNGNVSRTDFTKFSQINLAFANPDESGAVSFTDLSPDQVIAVVSKCHQANTKIAVSIGGGAADTELWLNHMVGDPRAVVVTSLIGLVEEYGFDGIDVDLEGDLVLSEHYEAFVESLHNQLPQGIIYTAALANWSANGLSYEMLSLYDYVNIMSYDYTGPWAPDKPGQHSSYQQAVFDMNYWKETKNLLAENIVLGVPFYGYDFQDQTQVYYVAYKDILMDNPGAENSDKVGTTYYNGVSTMQSKTELSMQYGGIMIWEITQDVDLSDDRSLLATIMSVIYPEVLVAVTNDFDSVLYPNPVTDFLSVSPEYKRARIIVRDMEGKVILDRILENGNLDVRSLKAGVYIASIQHEKEESRWRFTKQ